MKTASALLADEMSHRCPTTKTVAMTLKPTTRIRSAAHLVGSHVRLYAAGAGARGSGPVVGVAADVTSYEDGVRRLAAGRQICRAIIALD